MEYLKLEVTQEDHQVQLPAPRGMWFSLLTLSSSPLHPGPGGSTKALLPSFAEQNFSQRNSFLM